MEFHEKLQNLRKEKIMTQEELAEKLNVSRQAVSKWESNQTMPETDKIIQIANLFDVSLDYLLKGEKETQNKKRLIYNTTQLKKPNRSFVTGIVVLSLGFVGILTFCILYILHPINLINEKGIYSGFNIFLRANDMWIMFLICCVFSFLGLLLISKNIIANIFTKICRAYIRQNRFVKYGIIISFLGAVMIFASLIINLSQVGVVSHTFETVDSISGKTVDIISDTVQQRSFNPMILLISSLMVMVSGLVMLAIGIIKKLEIND